MRRFVGPVALEPEISLVTVGAIDEQTDLDRVAALDAALSQDTFDTSLDSLDGETHARWLDLVDLAASRGIKLEVRSTLRSCDKQRALYQIGRTPGDARKTVTNANGCVSWHTHGRAVDFNASENRYAEVGALAKSLGFKWGGDFPGFPDLGHVEWHPGLTIEQACPNPNDCSSITVDNALPDHSGGGTMTGGESSVISQDSLVVPIVLAAALAVGGVVLYRRLA